MLLNVSVGMLREIEEYERNEYIKQNRMVKRKYPSNEEVVNAIKNLTGGTINKHVIDNFYEVVRKYLKDKGFDVSALNEKGFEDLQIT
jgi:hypothetical protein